jgi:hypothetical protein
MFFRRTKPKTETFSDRVGMLKQAEFSTEDLPDGRVMIKKHGVGAVIGDEAKNHAQIEKAGILVGSQIATLLNRGYQMFLEMPSGQLLPATSEQLESLHEFEEDVKDALGLTSLYNTSLGTTTQKHLYDRVFKRDSGAQPRPWIKKQNRIAPPHTKGTQPS